MKKIYSKLVPWLVCVVFAVVAVACSLPDEDGYDNVKVWNETNGTIYAYMTYYNDYVDESGRPARRADDGRIVPLTCSEIYKIMNTRSIPVPARQYRAVGAGYFIWIMTEASRREMLEKGPDGPFEIDKVVSVCGENSEVKDGIYVFKGVK